MEVAKEEVETLFQILKLLSTTYIIEGVTIPKPKIFEVMEIVINVILRKILVELTG